MSFDARIKTAGAHDDRPGRHLGQRLSPEVVALHEAGALLVVEREDGIRHSERLGDALAQQIRIRLARRAGQRRSQEIEPHIGIESARSRREQQLILFEEIDKGLLGDIGERVIGRAGLVRHLAGKSAGVGGEIDEAHGFAVTGRHLHVPAEVLLEGIGQGDGARHRLRGKDGAGKGLRDRTDAEDRLAVRGGGVRSGERLAETGNGAFTIAHGADDEARYLVPHKGHHSGEFHGLLEQPILRRRTRGERGRNGCRERHPAQRRRAVGEGSDWMHVRLRCACTVSTASVRDAGRARRPVAHSPDRVPIRSSHWRRGSRRPSAAYRL